MVSPTIKTLKSRKGSDDPDGNGIMPDPCLPETDFISKSDTSVDGEQLKAEMCGKNIAQSKKNKNRSKASYGKIFKAKLKQLSKFVGSKTRKKKRSHARVCEKSVTNAMSKTRDENKDAFAFDNPAFAVCEKSMETKANLDVKPQLHGDCRKRVSSTLKTCREQTDIFNVLEVDNFGPNCNREYIGKTIVRCDILTGIEIHQKSPAFNHIISLEANYQQLLKTRKVRPYSSFELNPSCSHTSVWNEGIRDLPALTSKNDQRPDMLPTNRPQSCFGRIAANNDSLKAKKNGAEGQKEASSMETCTDHKGSPTAFSQYGALGDQHNPGNGDDTKSTEIGWGPEIRATPSEDIKPNDIEHYMDKNLESGFGVSTKGNIDGRSPALRGDKCAGSTQDEVNLSHKDVSVNKKLQQDQEFPTDQEQSGHTTEDILCEETGMGEKDMQSAVVDEAAKTLVTLPIPERPSEIMSLGETCVFVADKDLGNTEMDCFQLQMQTVINEVTAKMTEDAQSPSKLIGSDTPAVMNSFKYQNTQGTNGFDMEQAGEQSKKGGIRHRSRQGDKATQKAPEAYQNSSNMGQQTQDAPGRCQQGNTGPKNEGGSSRERSGNSENKTNNSRLVPDDAGEVERNVIEATKLGPLQFEKSGEDSTSNSMQLGSEVLSYHKASAIPGYTKLSSNEQGISAQDNQAVNQVEVTNPGQSKTTNSNLIQKEEQPLSSQTKEQEVDDNLGRKRSQDNVKTPVTKAKKEVIQNLSNFKGPMTQEPCEDKDAAPSLDALSSNFADMPEQTTKLVGWEKQQQQKCSRQLTGTVDCLAATENEPTIQELSGQSNQPKEQQKTQENQGGKAQESRSNDNCDQGNMCSSSGNTGSSGSEQSNSVNGNPLQPEKRTQSIQIKEQGAGNPTQESNRNNAKSPVTTAKAQNQSNINYSKAQNPFEDKGVKSATLSHGTSNFSNFAYTQRQMTKSVGRGEQQQQKYSGQLTANASVNNIKRSCAAAIGNKPTIWQCSGQSNQPKQQQKKQRNQSGKAQESSSNGNYGGSSTSMSSGNTGSSGSGDDDENNNGKKRKNEPRDHYGAEDDEETGKCRENEKGEDDDENSMPVMKDHISLNGQRNDDVCELQSANKSKLTSETGTSLERFIGNKLLARTEGSRESSSHDRKNENANFEDNTDVDSGQSENPTNEGHQSSRLKGARPKQNRSECGNQRQAKKAVLAPAAGKNKDNDNTMSITGTLGDTTFNLQKLAEPLEPCGSFLPSVSSKISIFEVNELGPRSSSFESSSSSRLHTTSPKASGNPGPSTEDGITKQWYETMLQRTELPESALSPANEPTLSELDEANHQEMLSSPEQRTVARDNAIGKVGNANEDEQDAEAVIRCSETSNEVKLSTRKGPGHGADALIKLGERKILGNRAPEKSLQQHKSGPENLQHENRSVGKPDKQSPQEVTSGPLSEIRLAAHEQGNDDEAQSRQAPVAEHSADHAEDQCKDERERQRPSGSPPDEGAQQAVGSKQLAPAAQEITETGEGLNEDGNQESIDSGPPPIALANYADPVEENIGPPMEQFTGSTLHLQTDPGTESTRVNPNQAHPSLQTSLPMQETVRAAHSFHRALDETAARDENEGLNQHREAENHGGSPGIERGDGVNSKRALGASSLANNTESADISYPRQESEGGGTSSRTASNEFSVGDAGCLEQIAPRNSDSQTDTGQQWTRLYGTLSETSSQYCRHFNAREHSINHSSPRQKRVCRECRGEEELGHDDDFGFICEDCKRAQDKAFTSISDENESIRMVCECNSGGLWTRRRREELFHCGNCDRYFCMQLCLDTHQCNPKAF